MGRKEEYALNNDKSLKDQDQNKKVFQLVPIAIPKSQNVKVESALSDLDIMISKKLINRTIKDSKISGMVGMSGRHYFGF